VIGYMIALCSVAVLRSITSTEHQPFPLVSKFMPLERNEVLCNLTGTARTSRNQQEQAVTRVRSEGQEQLSHTLRPGSTHGRASPSDEPLPGCSSGPDHHHHHTHQGTAAVLDSTVCCQTTLCQTFWTSRFGKAPGGQPSGVSACICLQQRHPIHRTPVGQPTRIIRLGCEVSSTSPKPSGFHLL
jgi:hypothetical protein